MLILNLNKKQKAKDHRIKNEVDKIQKNRLERIDLAIFSGCNLRCKHCYQADSKERNLLLHLDKIKEILSDAKKMGASELTLTGGEPLLHPNFNEILHFAGKLGYKIRLLTNGVFVTKQIADKLVKYPVDVQISLDGTKEIHEFLRGQNTFKQTIRGIKFLVSQNIRVIINTQLTSKIFPKIDKYVNSLNSLGVSEVIFSITGLFGAAEYNQIFTPSNCLKQIRKILNIDIKQQQKNQETHKCGALINRLAINYDGVVYPCDFFKSIGHYSLGNIYHEKIGDIYTNWANSNCGLIKYLTKGLKECNDCKFKNLCQACPARIFSIYKDFNHPDLMY